MHKLNTPKIALFVALVSFSMDCLRAEEKEETAREPVEAIAVYKKISALLKSGDLAGAHALMTDEQRDGEIGSMMVNLATDVVAKRPIPKQLKDGTKINVTPADLGFDDTWDPPAWMKTKKMAAPSSGWDALEKDLLKRFNALPDRKSALRKLNLITRSLGGRSLFAERIVAPRDGFKPRANRLWVSNEDNAEHAYALRFEKHEGGWKYAGIDWETDDQVAALWKFEEKKEHPIAGKGPHGEDVSLKVLEGKMVLIDFWGTW